MSIYEQLSNGLAKHRQFSPKNYNDGNTIAGPQDFRKVCICDFHVLFMLCEVLIHSTEYNITVESLI